MTTQSKHDAVVDIIRRHPYSLGIEDAVLSTDEVIFFGKDRFLTAPDSLIFTKTRDIFVVEYKSNNKKREQSLKQLSRHVQHTRDYFNANEIYGLYVYGPARRLTVEVC